MSSNTFLSVRFGNVLGSRGSVLTAFKAQVAAGGPITVTHPNVSRYLMTIQEAVQLVIQAAAIGRDGEARKVPVEQERPTSVDAGRLEHGAPAQKRLVVGGEDRLVRVDEPPPSDGDGKYVHQATPAPDRTRPPGPSTRWRPGSTRWTCWGPRTCRR